MDRRKNYVYLGRQLGKSCLYCGYPSDQQDHVLPFSKSYQADQHLALIVPCCAECNSIAGDKVFKSIDDKQDFIRGRLWIKYKSELEKWPINSPRRKTAFARLNAPSARERLLAIADITSTVQRAVEIALMAEKERQSQGHLDLDMVLKLAKI